MMDVWGVEFLQSPGGVLPHSPNPPQPFDIMSSLQRVRPWQEQQHLSSPLEGVGILVFVKMVETWKPEREWFPQTRGASLKKHSRKTAESRVDAWTVTACVYLCVSEDTMDEKQLVSEEKGRTNPLDSCTPKTANSMIQVIPLRQKAVWGAEELQVQFALPSMFLGMQGISNRK